MNRLVISAAARRDIANALQHSAQRWGPAQRRQYRLLIEHTLADLLDNPQHPASRPRDEIRPGVGPLYPFRGISCRGVRPDLVEQELRALHVPGLDFHRVSVPDPHTGQPATGLYIEVTDWDAWRPCELNFDLMRLACRLTRHNPFATMTAAERAAYLRLMGSTAFFNDISHRDHALR